MARFCEKCKKKIGLFDKIYMEKYCLECFNKSVEEDKQKIEIVNELVIKDELSKVEEELNKKKEEDAKKYLLYSTSNLKVIMSIMTLPFHYSNFFRRKN